MAGRPITDSGSRVLSALLGTFLLAACATSPTGRSQFMLVSPNAAILESEKAYISTVNALKKEGKLLHDPQLAAKVRRVTGRIITAAVRKFPHSAEWDWSVALIDEPETVNAWCMAGGRMAAYNGLFKKLALTEAEFAQIMGHEIAHALADHVAERMSIAMVSKVGALAVGAATESDIALTGTALAAQLAIGLPNSRTAESEADQIGVELAALAGYDPQAAVSLWEKMAAQGDGDSGFDFLSTHPAPVKRRKALEALVPRMRRLQRADFLAPHRVTILQKHTPGYP